MKPFNLEEYIENPSRKVVMRNGTPVRIICTDSKFYLPIIALAKKPNGNEKIKYYPKMGNVVTALKTCFLMIMNKYGTDL